MIYGTQLPWLLQGQGPNRPSDMPIGQMVRNPATMGTAELQREMSSLGAPWSPMASRAPGMLGGLLTGLGGFPGLGLALGFMGNRGMQNRRNALFTENQTRQIANMYPSAGSAPTGIMGGNTNGGGRSDADMAQAGLGDWDDETGFGGA